MKIRDDPNDLPSQGSKRVRGRDKRVVIPQRVESIFQCHVYRVDVVDLTLSLTDLRIDWVMCLDSSEMFSLFERG